MVVVLSLSANYPCRVIGPPMEQLSNFGAFKNFVTLLTDVIET